MYCCLLFCYFCSLRIALLNRELQGLVIQDFIRPRQLRSVLERNIKDQMQFYKLIACCNRLYRYLTAMLFSITIASVILVFAYKNVENLFGKIYFALLMTYGMAVSVVYSLAAKSLEICCTPATESLRREIWQCSTSNAA